MSERWFATGAFTDSPLAVEADNIFDPNALDKKRLFETDIFFISSNDPRRKMLPKHLLLLDQAAPDEVLERSLIRFGGADFLSRLGHDIVNLFSPLREYELISEATFKTRTEQGVRLGKQVNLIGHLLQEDLPLGEAVPVEEFLLHITENARRHGRSIVVDHTRDTSSFSSVPARLVEPLTDEILLNLMIHSSGGEHIIVSASNRSVAVVNNTPYRFPYSRIKAVLRRPFQKFGRTDGNGMGLFIIGLIAYTGGFSWDIAAQEGHFSLSFSFGASPSPAGNAAK